MAVLRIMANPVLRLGVGIILLSQLFLLSAHTLPAKKTKDGKGLRGSDDSWMHPAPKHRSRSSQASRSANAVVEDETFWYSDARAKLMNKFAQVNIEKEAKNTILFLGDGMSIPTVTASRIFKGQAEGLPNGGEEGELHFDTFPHTALSKTYCVDKQVADSACSATAYLCGTKANYRTIGVSPRVLEQDCVGQQNADNQISSILAWAQAAGKSTGIISTARITHASPAGTYAHIANRDWESDYNVDRDGQNTDECDDIAEQLILHEPGRSINVILGGGRANFFDKTMTDPEEEIGNRIDGKNLVKSWLQDKTRAKYVTGADELLAVDTANTDYLFGLFAADHMAYKNESAADNDPTLEEMTRVAIEILSKNPNGYFLFVEGGKIDHAHHDTWAQRAMIETIEFDLAIKAADELTSDDDTLLVVTADHAHVMTINGYPPRGNPLLGMADMADDDLPYSTLSYANGPGYREQIPHPVTGKCVRADQTEDDFLDLDYRQPGLAIISSETHGGDDVGIFAKGPWAHLFSGVVQQNFIPHAMAFAACIGSGPTYCKQK